jgi:SHS2 domain-containing protein
VKAPFEILEHPSDLGIEAHGKSMDELFRNMALGLMSVIAGKSKIQTSEHREVFIPAIDRENLLVRWLTEILYLYEANKFLTADVRFESLSDTSLKATVLGERYDVLKHTLKLDVKAITYHQLKIYEKDGRWIGRIFVDI